MGRGCMLGPVEPQVLAEPPVLDVEAPPTLGEMERRTGGGREVGGGGEVTRVVTHPKVGQDGYGGQAIYVR